MKEKTLYDTLGVKSSADADQLKQAYRKKANILHPDKNNGKDTGFKELALAYRVLSDPEKRKTYDTTGNSTIIDMEGMVREIVVQLFMEIVNAADVQYDDIFQLMRNNINAQKSALEANVEQRRGSIKKYEKAIARLISTDTLLRTVLENQVRAETQSIVTILKEVEKFPLILDMIGKYKYKTDKRPQFGGYTTSSFRVNPTQW